MGSDRTTADALLKEVYGDHVYDQLNHENRAGAHFKRSETAKWTGRAFIESLRTGRNRGIKAMAERGLLPVAGEQGYNKLTIPMRRWYGAIEVTAAAIAEVRNEGAFIDATEAEITGMVKDLQVEENRMVWGFGVGTLALVNDPAAATMTGGSTTLPIDTPLGVAGSVNGARHIRVGDVIACHAAAPANNTPLITRTVTAVAADGSSLTIASADETECPDNGIITRGVTRSAVEEGSWNLEPMGILGLIDDGTFVTTIHGLSRTTVPLFKANVFTSVGTLDEDIFHRAYDKTDEISGVAPTWLTAHHSVHRRYIQMVLPDRRFTGAQANNPDAGIKGGGKKSELEWGGDPIEKERFCPYGKLYGIDDSACRSYESEKGKWIDEDGAILSRVVGQDIFEAYYRVFRNHAVIQSNSSFVLDGINATVDVVNAE